MAHMVFHECTWQAAIFGPSCCSIGTQHNVQLRPPQTVSRTLLMTLILLDIMYDKPRNAASMVYEQRRAGVLSSTAGDAR